MRWVVASAALVVAVLVGGCEGGGPGGGADPSCCALRRLCERCACDGTESLIAAIGDGEACRRVAHEGCDFLSPAEADALCAPPPDSGVDCCALGRLCDGCSCNDLEHLIAARGDDAVCAELDPPDCPAFSVAQAQAACGGGPPSGPTCCELRAMCRTCACSDATVSVAVLGDEDACARTGHTGCAVFGPADAAAACESTAEAPTCCQLGLLCDACSCGDLDALAAAVGNETACREHEIDACEMAELPAAIGRCDAGAGPSCCALRQLCDRCACSTFERTVSLRGDEAHCRAVEHDGCDFLSRADAEAACP